MYEDVVVRCLVADPIVSMRLHESDIELDTAWSWDYDSSDPSESRLLDSTDIELLDESERDTCIPAPTVEEIPLPPYIGSNSTYAELIISRTRDSRWVVSYIEVSTDNIIVYYVDNKLSNAVAKAYARIYIDDMLPDGSERSYPKTFSPKRCCHMGKISADDLDDILSDEALGIRSHTSSVDESDITRVYNNIEVSTGDTGYHDRYVHDGCKCYYNTEPDHDVIDKLLELLIKHGTIVFEDGIATKFSDELCNMIREHGNKVTDAILYILRMDVYPSNTLAEALRWVASSDHLTGTDKRTTLVLAMGYGNDYVKIGALDGIRILGDVSLCNYISLFRKHETSPMVLRHMDTVANLLCNKLGENEYVQERQ